MDQHGMIVFNVAGTQLRENEMTDEIYDIIKDAIKHPRSRKEITKTFQDAGIIDENGDLKEPYKNIKIPK
jgi:hypothetical protein